MKTSWNVLAFVAIVNFLALLLLGSWLGATGRVNSDRIESVRTLFAEPVATVAERAEQAELEARKQADLAAEEDSLTGLPASSDIPILAAEQLARREQVLLRRVEMENMRDRRVLDEHERQLAARERTFEARVAAFEEAQARARATEQAQEYQTAVKLLESLPPRQGKDQILLRVRDGDLDKAVSYLRSMRASARNEIFAAMKTEEEQNLASALLERLSGPSIPAVPLAEIANAERAEPSLPD